DQMRGERMVFSTIHAALLLLPISDRSLSAVYSRRSYADLARAMDIAPWRLRRALPYCAAGKVKLNVEPCPSALVTVMSPPCSSVFPPPCSSTRALVSISPSPVPRPPWVTLFWARKNLVKRRAWSSGERPTPVPRTLTRTPLPSPRAVMVTLPPDAVYLCAFE